jgi:Polysaccharide deacetylase
MSGPIVVIRLTSVSMLEDATHAPVMFEEFLAAPVFVLTGDQDWAPDWALEAMLEVVADEGIPFHLFVTNPSPLLDVAEKAGVTLGIHPNFLAGSSHGATEDQVIGTCLELVPGATSFRSHSFHENSRILIKLLERGLIAMSHPLCLLQPGLVPMIQGTGMLRFPVVLEDDTFLTWAAPALDLRLVMELILTPGLKVLNFHPGLVALNVPSIDYYDAHREVLYGGRSQAGACYSGRGASTVLVELIRNVKAAGCRFIAFPELVEQAYRSLESALPGGLYGWRPW